MWNNDDIIIIISSGIQQTIASKTAFLFRAKLSKVNRNVQDILTIRF